MKKSVFPFVLALLAAVLFGSCSDGSGSGSASGADGIVTDSRKMVTATPQADGIHFSIEIPAMYARLGGVGINIFRDIKLENGETVQLEAGIGDKKDTSDLVYPLVKAGETYTFSINMEPEDKSDIDWRAKYIYSESVTVTAEGGLGDFTGSGGSVKPKITKYEESDDPDRCVRFYFDSSDITFPEIKVSRKYAVIFVGDPDHWDSYTQWIGGDSYEENGEQYVLLKDDVLSDYDRYLAEVRRQTGKELVMIQSRWSFTVPDSSKGFSYYLISTRMSDTQDIAPLKKISEE